MKNSLCERLLFYPDFFDQLIGFHRVTPDWCKLSAIAPLVRDDFSDPEKLSGNTFSSDPSKQIPVSIDDRAQRTDLARSRKFYFVVGNIDLNKLNLGTGGVSPERQNRPSTRDR